MNIKAYLAKIGAKGGKSKSPAKTAAARKANAARWRNHKPKRAARLPNDELSGQPPKTSKQKYGKTTIENQKRSVCSLQ